MNPNIPLLLSIKDIKKMIGVTSDATIYNYMNAGVLPYKQIGKFRRFSLDDVQQFLKNCNPSKKLSK